MAEPARRFYGKGPPGVPIEKLTGKLLVLEGADGSGRTTLIDILKPWLEGHGRAVTTFGIKRSNLVGQELDEAKQGHTLGRTTMALFYATDFADQIENVIIPSLRAGFVVLADRYIYTLMARDIVRGLEADWVARLYGIALVPDAVFYLSVSPQILLERNFAKNKKLDYWESGMDIGLQDNIFDSFILYQKRMRAQFMKMKDTYGFQVINANRPVWLVARDLQTRIAQLMNIRM